MGYNKFIRSGNNVEIYEYEYDILPRGDKRYKEKKNKKKIDRNAELTEAEVGKRMDNVRKAKMEFRRLVSSNLDEKNFPLLLTATYKENFTDLNQAYYDHKLFVQTLRYTYGKDNKDFKYICVPEFQERGAVHFHTLCWGLPADILLPERLTDYYKNVSPTLSKIWGNGFVLLKPTDGNDKLSSYLSKYMTKAFIDPRLKHQKAYTSSRNVHRSYVVSDISPVWPLIDDYAGVDAVPITDNKYHSHYLGDARYRLFKIKE